MRNNYLSKLIQKKIWTPTLKKKLHNSLIIFDWDDTLMPTSFLYPNGDIRFRNEFLSDLENQQKLKKLDENVFNLLSLAVKKSDTYIITNAQKGWVQFSAKKNLPKTYFLLMKSGIKIISAREFYEKIFPGDLRQWKIETFLKFSDVFDRNLITNIISLGDSKFEMDAAKTLHKRFSNAFIKNVKFKETPNLNDLIKQLELIIRKFPLIFSTVKNLTIRLEEIRKSKISNLSKI